MKSYSLVHLDSVKEVPEVHSKVLPGQSEPWLLLDASGDAVAYFCMTEDEDRLGRQMIQADISGRHYNEDDSVLAVLRRLQSKLGGEIENDL